MDDPCLTDAEGCEAVLQSGEPCDADARFGRLCERHARQLAYAPMGAGRRKVVRRQLGNLTEREVNEAEAAYLASRGYTPPSSANPYSYVPAIVSYIGERGEARSSEVTAHVQTLSPWDITAGKTGQVLRMLTAQGVLERRSDGRFNVYRLTGSEGAPEN